MSTNVERFREACIETCNNQIKEHGESRRRKLADVAAAIVDGSTRETEDVDYNGDDFIVGAMGALAIVRFSMVGGFAGFLAEPLLNNALSDFSGGLGFLMQFPNEAEAARKELIANITEEELDAVERDLGKEERVRIEDEKRGM